MKSNPKPKSSSRCVWFGVNSDNQDNCGLNALPETTYEYKSNSGQLCHFYTTYCLLASPVKILPIWIIMYTLAMYKCKLVLLLPYQK